MKSAAEPKIFLTEIMEITDFWNEEDSFSLK